jgi:hypothetical protein
MEIPSNTQKKNKKKLKLKLRKIQRLKNTLKKKE